MGNCICNKKIQDPPRSTLTNKRAQLPQKSYIATQQRHQSLKQESPMKNKKKKTVCDLIDKENEEDPEMQDYRQQTKAQIFKRLPKHPPLYARDQNSEEKTSKTIKRDTLCKKFQTHRRRKQIEEHAGGLEKNDQHFESLDSSKQQKEVKSPKFMRDKERVTPVLATEDQNEGQFKPQSTFIFKKSPLLPLEQQKTKLNQRVKSKLSSQTQTPNTVVQGQRMEDEDSYEINQRQEILGASIEIEGASSITLRNSLTKVEFILPKYQAGPLVVSTLDYQLYAI